MSPIVIADPDLAEIIPSYLEARRKDVRKLQDAFAIQDFAAIESVGHKMLGTGASYGFDALSEIGQTLELAAQLRDSIQIRHKIDELRDYLGSLDVRYPSIPAA